MTKLATISVALLCIALVGCSDAVQPTPDAPTDVLPEPTSTQTIQSPIPLGDAEANQAVLDGTIAIATAVELNDDWTQADQEVRSYLASVDAEVQPALREIAAKEMLTTHLLEMRSPSAEARDAIALYRNTLVDAGSNETEIILAASRLLEEG